MPATFPLSPLYLTTINKSEGSSPDKCIDYDLQGSKPNVFPRNGTIMF